MNYVSDWLLISIVENFEGQHTEEQSSDSEISEVEQDSHELLHTHSQIMEINGQFMLNPVFLSNRGFKKRPRAPKAAILHRVQSNFNYLRNDLVYESEYV